MKAFAYDERMLKELDEEKLERYKPRFLRRKLPKQL